MATSTDHISRLLAATLDAQNHRKAENALKEEAKKAKYSLNLLSIVSSDARPYNIRLAASLAFKNFIRHSYVDEDGRYKLPLDEVKTIKREIVGLMISSPATIQTQLGEAISVIADSDFWERWDTLTRDLVSRLSDTDFKVTNGVLEVAHSIYVRWRPLFPSNDLNREILHVVDHFGGPFIQMLGIADKQIEANPAGEPALSGWLETMSLLMRILFDLSCQDIPPVIESNIVPITEVLKKYLSYTNPVFKDEEDETTPLETLKADVCDVLQLFTNKYDEDFGQHVQPFTNDVWNVLSSLGPEKRYDNLTCKALNFLTAVASGSHAEIFNSEAILGTIVEKVILPNVALRQSDIEMFEDEPIEFIRRDLEGSDTDSRRRSATDFLRKLLDRYEELVSSVVFKYISHYLQTGKADWKAKDTAVYLFLAIAAKGAVTAAQGVKTVNPLVNVSDFFEQNIASDLINDSGVEPISKVDAIKYLYTFRSQLAREAWLHVFQPLVKNLASTNYVVYTYATIAVERVLALTDDHGQHVLTREDIQPLAKDLLDHLFALIEQDPSPAKLQENEFLMRCIMRVLIVMKDGSEAMMDDVLNHFINITNVIKENPSNPRFYYYHFEAVGALVRFCAQTSGAKLHARLWEPFSYILKEDVSEFVPFVFQIFAALLELNRTSAAPDNFKSLLAPILSLTLWETRGNVPPLARFLSAIVPKVAQEIVITNQVEVILGIFQRLLSGKKTEQQAFEILEASVDAFEASVLDPYFQTILRLIFSKLDKNPTDSYKTRAVHFYHLVSAKQGLGADYFIQHAEKIQTNVFVPFYLQVVLPTTLTFARPVARKLGVISYTKTLCDSAAFAHRYQKGWGYTCNNLLDLLKNAPRVTAGVGDEIINEADVDDIGFGVGYTQLNTCRAGPRDYFPDIVEVEKWVAKYMKEANVQSSGAIISYASDPKRNLSNQAKAALAPYLQ